MEELPKFDQLESRVHKLVSIVEQLDEHNNEIASELQQLKLKEKDNDMDMVKREIIRTKVQNMLNLLEDI